MENKLPSKKSEKLSTALEKIKIEHEELAEYLSKYINRPYGETPAFYVVVGDSKADISNRLDKMVKFGYLHKTEEILEGIDDRETKKKVRDKFIGESGYDSSDDLISDTREDLATMMKIIKKNDKLDNNHQYYVKVDDNKKEITKILLDALYFGYTYQSDRIRDFVLISE